MRIVSMYFSFMFVLTSGSALYLQLENTPRLSVNLVLWWGRAGGVVLFSSSPSILRSFFSFLIFLFLFLPPLAFSLVQFAKQPLVST